MIRAIAVICVLGGCAQVQQTADNVARKQAKNVVNAQVSSVLPGVNVSFATDCIIDNANAQELFSLARASVTGVDAASGQLISGIATRTDTLKCILNKRLGVS